MKMKKIILIAGTFAAVLVSCSKTSVDVPQSEILFQVAGHSLSTKAIDDYKDNYKDVPFGTYAWFKGELSSDDRDFMTNQSVSYEESKNRWAPTGTTYYWPRSGSIDFVSYSPYTGDGENAPAPTITEDGIKYPAWNVDSHPDVDVMYSDKVTGQTGNVNTYNHGYEGVPTLFRHALAKVEFRIRAMYLTKTAPTGDVTRWEITVNSLTLSNLLTTGTLELTLGEDGSWVKPESNVWDPGTGSASHTMDVDDEEGLTTTSKTVGAPFLVLPQLLEDQVVTMNVDIKTYRDNNDGTGEHLVYTESGVEVTGHLSTDEIDRWGINQSIIYEIGFSPSLTEDDVPEPVEIWFDPAVADWEKITVTQIIQL